jgi:hypothetical protein
MYVLEKIMLKIVRIKSRSEFEYMSRLTRLLVNPIYSNHVIYQTHTNSKLLLKCSLAISSWLLPS